MLEDDPTDAINDPRRVLILVREFIDSHKISAPETIHQSDRIIEDAYDFIEELCEAAGYAPGEDGDLFDDDTEEDDFYDRENPGLED